MSETLNCQTFLPGSLIFREGEAGDCAYVIKSGLIEISVLKQGKKVVLAKLKAGDLFGEMALIDGQVRSATANTLDETTLIVIQRDQVKKRINQTDPLLSLFLNVILERLRSTNNLVELVEPGLNSDNFPSSPATRNQSYEQVHERAISVLQLEEELRQAVDQKEFELYYQPIIAMRGGHTAGFEALIRWHHPRRGLLTPNNFIGLAEESGLIVPMGMWVIEEAGKALDQFQNAFGKSFPSLPKIYMSVNISAQQILEPDLIENINNVFEKNRIDPARFQLEITESILMEDPKKAATVLNKLKALGIKLVIDDFGTGYSSLSYLHRFPIDALKIDRSFVNMAVKDSGSLKILRAITRLAKELDISVTAEGVEKVEELTLVRDCGCDYTQGYFFSRPVPLEDAEKAAMKRF